VTSVVARWNVSGKGDYDKLARDFGTLPITQEILERFQHLTGHMLHRWLRRDFFLRSHIF
jgi:tryptophanyl-tRNA synthetase